MQLSLRATAHSNFGDDNMKQLALFLLTTILLISSAAPAFAAPDPTFVMSASLIFNNPKGTTTQKYAIITQVNKAIDNVAAGSTIWIAEYLHNIQSSTDKLIAAHKRGVNVKMIIDSAATPQITALKSELGTDRSKASFVIRCEHSCMSSDTSVMHAKFFLFSRTGSSRLVSMVSSANLYTGNTTGSWNNIHTSSATQRCMIR